VSEDTGGAMTAEEVFNELVSVIDYPMFVVTAASGDERSGCLAGFAAQCSINPPRFMVWLSKNNHTFRTASRAAALGIHFLSSDQRSLAELFGTETGDQTDKFGRCRWRAVHGTPVLTDCSRWFVGRVIERLDTGDHVAFMIEPLDGGASPWSGQLGFQSLHDLTPGHPA